MRRLSLCLLLGVVPAVALTVLSLGCSGGDNKGGGGGGGGGGKAGEAKTEGAQVVDFKGGRGTVKGKVTLEGGPPMDAIKTANEQLKAQMEMQKDKDVCLSPNASPEEKEQQFWRVGEGNGLANVVVWVRPASGRFQLEEADLKPYQDGGAKHEVKIDQPHCAFIPHVSVAFPNYNDKPSGQVVEVLNSAPISHNTKWGGTSKNPGENPIIPGKMGDEIHKVALNVKPENNPIPLTCSIHGWMNGYIWALDTPFAAVTDKDGNFEIKGVPAGHKLKIIAWHEKAEYLGKGKAGEDVEVNKDETKTVNLAAKK
jgi:hypothetical protein